jgi:hypothetical protein
MGLSGRAERYRYSHLGRCSIVRPPPPPSAELLGSEGEERLPQLCLQVQGRSQRSPQRRLQSHSTIGLTTMV